MSHNNDEKRRFNRLPFAVEVRIYLAGQTYEATTRDISATGLFITDADPLPENELCDLEIKLSSGGLEQVIKAEGQIVRRVEGLENRGTGIGVKFVRIDSFSQDILWHVIRYNSPVTDQA